MRNFLTIVILLLASFAIKAQDAVFSQFFSSPLYLNPAFAGNTYAPKIAFNYRNQWPSLKAFVTFAASYDQLIPSLNSGIGITLLADDAGRGIYKSNKMGISYAYLARLSDDKVLKLGTQVGFTNIKLDWNKLRFYDQIDILYGFNDSEGNPNPTFEKMPESLSNSYFDVAAGFSFYSPGFYIGLSAKHLLTPDESLLHINQNLNVGLNLLVSLQAGGQINFNRNNKRHNSSFFSPNIVLIKQGDFYQLNGGGYVKYGLLFAGGWFRHSVSNPDAIIGLVGIQRDILKIGFSYDITVSSLTSAPTGGASEISLVLNLENSERNKRKRWKERYNDCFDFFR